jgi:hypothetical protein
VITVTIRGGKVSDGKEDGSDRPPEEFNLSSPMDLRGKLETTRDREAAFAAWGARRGLPTASVAPDNLDAQTTTTEAADAPATDENSLAVPLAGAAILATGSMRRTLQTGAWDKRVDAAMERSEERPLTLTARLLERMRGLLGD